MKSSRLDLAGCIVLVLAALLIGLPSAAASDVATVVAQFEQMTLPPGAPLC